METYTFFNYSFWLHGISWEILSGSSTENFPHEFGWGFDQIRGYGGPLAS